MAIINTFANANDLIGFAPLLSGGAGGAFDPARIKNN